MGMSDLISRQAAIEEILGCCPSDPFGSEYECGYDDGLRQGVHRLKHLPTTDAVPVVRCGNCAKRGKNGKGIPGGCPFGMTDDTCDPNAYCSYGVLSMKAEQRWTEKGKSRK